MKYTTLTLTIAFGTVLFIGCGTQRDNPRADTLDRNSAEATAQQQRDNDMHTDNTMRTDNDTMRTDNTGINERDRNSSEPTADQQKENETDRDLTQRIRQSVVAHDNFSTYAKNIKIISQNGRVTLKGPVASAEEKRSIVAMAVSATGDAARVTDEITVEN